MKLKRMIAALCCAALFAGMLAGLPAVAAAAETEYVYAEMDGFDSYTRVALAQVAVSGVKQPQPSSAALPFDGISKSVRLTATELEEGATGISISSCRAPDTDVDKPFVNGAHLNPSASGKSFNVFGDASPADSVGIRVGVATDASGSPAVVAGSVRIQLTVSPSRGLSTAELYEGYDRGFVFETPDYPIGADGFANVLFEDAVPIDSWTPEDADFVNDYLPLVNAVNIIITPDSPIAAGKYYYLAGVRAYREKAEYSVYATSDGVCSGKVVVSGISEHGGELALKMDGAPMPQFITGAARVDGYGANRVDYVVETGVIGDGSHVFTLLLDGEAVCEQTLYFDNTPPYLAYSSVANGSAQSASGRLEMTAGDGESGVKSFSVKLDGAAVTLPYSYSGLADGAHSVIYSITDNAGITATGSIIFSVGSGVVFGDYTADGGSVTLEVGGANSARAYAYSVGGALPVTAYENAAAALSALPEKTPEGERASAVGAKTVTHDEKYPYQAFEVDVSGVEGDEVYVSVSAAANVGETLRLTVYNETNGGWEEVDRARMEAVGVTLSAAVSLADRVADGKLKLRVSLLSVDNGADTFTWCTDAQHMIQHNYEDGSYRDYTYYIRDQFNLFIREYNEGRIGYVINTGDISDEPNNTAMFAECRGISDILDNANIPNGVVAGNHDANWTNWCPYYGAKYYDYQDWWGGDYGDNKGHYDLVTIGGRDLVFVCLGWTMENDANATAWARKVFNTYPNRTGVLALHGYLGTDGEILFNTARKFWAIAEDCPNLNMIICGHEPGTARNIRYTSDGRPVLEMLHDYQSGSPANMWWKWLEGGSGLFRYVTIGDGTITNRTFTISKNDYIRVYGRNPDNEDGYYYYWDKDEENFTMPVRLVQNERRVEVRSFTARTVSEGAEAANARVSGGRVSFTGLPEGLWYVTCGGATSAVFPSRGGTAAAQPLITGAYGRSGSVSVSWELPDGAAADSFIIRADGELLAEVPGTAREYSGALARDKGEKARMTVTAVSGGTGACSEPREIVFSGVGAFVPGDSDGSGAVDVADALVTLRGAVGLAAGFTAEGWYASDIDRDGTLTVSDALLILRRAARLS